MPEIKITYDCPECGGSGLLFPNPKDKTVAVPCNVCKGNAYLELTYTPFIKQVILEGVEIVQNSRHSDSKVSYTEFLSGKRP